MPDIEFGGETFAGSEHGIPLASLMRFAHVAKGGADANDLDGLDALYRLLSKCIAPEDWERFLDTAERVNAKGDDLMAVVREVISGASKRPTGRPSDSSDGPVVIGPKSEPAPAFSSPPRPENVSSPISRPNASYLGTCPSKPIAGRFRS